jgi:hypothetical protein
MGARQAVWYRRLTARQQMALSHAGFLSFEALDRRFWYTSRQLTVILTVQCGYE